MIDIWGPHTWYLIHTICERINEDYYLNNKKECFEHLLLICKNVPCPHCRRHAVEKLKNISDVRYVPNKQKLREFFFNFHNRVNIDTNKKKVDIEVLNKFKTYSIVKILPYFKYTYGKQYYNRTDFSGYLRRDVINKIITWCQIIKID